MERDKVFDRLWEKLSPIKHMRVRKFVNHFSMSTKLQQLQCLKQNVVTIDREIQNNIVRYEFINYITLKDYLIKT